MHFGNLINVLGLVETGASNKYTCGNLDIAFNGMFPYLISRIYLILRIAIPVLLVIFGLLDLGKAVMAQKDDEIKKGQQTFFKRVVAAVIVFFIFAIVDLVVGILAGTDSKNIMNCVNCFIEGKVEAGKCVVSTP